MELAIAPLLNTLLALGALFLALSLLVQVVQEVYKFITSSKSVAYRKFLEDYLGPWALQLYDSRSALDLSVRGPFQFLRRKPEGKLLPLDLDALVSSLEQTLPPWHRRTLAALNTEVELQDNAPSPPSPSWISFVNELESTEESTSGYSDVQEILAFMLDWEASEGVRAPESDSDRRALNANRLRKAFRLTFLNNIEEVRRDYPQLMKNMGFAYRRRNLRQTFIIGFLLAVLFNLPFDGLYKKATAVSPTEALEMASHAQALYEGCATTRTGPAASQDSTSTCRILEEGISTLQDLVASERSGGGSQVASGLITSARAGTWPAIRHLGWCILTAVLISFGAPFWNDLVGALANLKQSIGSGPPKDDKETD